MHYIILDNKQLYYWFTYLLYCTSYRYFSVYTFYLLKIILVQHYAVFRLQSSALFRLHSMTGHSCRYQMPRRYVVWQKINDSDFILTMNLFFLQIKVIPFKVVPLGSYTETEALFPLFVEVLEGFCWCTFQLVIYAVLDIIQVPK